MQKFKLEKLIEKIVFLILNKFFRLLKKDLTPNIFASIMQFVRFGIVGISNTAISYIVYVIALSAFHKLSVFQKGDYLIAQIIAFVLSVLWSFYWNNKVVFTLTEGGRRSTWNALLKTFISYSFTGLFLNSILLFLWVQILNVSAFLAPIINLLISVPLNFIINKFWAFKENNTN